MPMQIMGLIWDPPPPPHTSTPVYNDISDNTYSASQWQYIYCFDVYHIKQREQLLLEEEERAVSRQSEADSESEGRSMHVPP
ncbi:hypothetical protein EON64_10195 [archaeon]|nr:MAG: hypothetical protein EON64_10195 [archaeon]